MHDVFISHKCGDTGTNGGPPPLEFAEVLEKALAERGVTAYPDGKVFAATDREQNHQGALALRLRVGNRVGRNTWV